MYDRLPLHIVEGQPDNDICKGVCLSVISSKGEQILGLLLEETDTSIKIAYPTRCFMEEHPDGTMSFDTVPYTKLPYLTVYKSSPIIKVPIHAESEFFYYEYLTDTVTDSEDFRSLLTDHGFDPDKSQEYYIQRHIDIEPYCDLLQDEDDDRSTEISTTGEKVIH